MFLFLGVSWIYAFFFFENFTQGWGAMWHNLIEHSKVSGIFLCIGFLIIFVGVTGPHLMTLKKEEDRIEQIAIAETLFIWATPWGLVALIVYDIFPTIGHSIWEYVKGNKVTVAPRETSAASKINQKQLEEHSADPIKEP